jgi:hypothetical protein
MLTLSKLGLVINKAILATLFNLNKNAYKCYNYRYKSYSLHLYLFSNTLKQVTNKSFKH